MESKYAVIVPKEIDPYYLYLAIQAKIKTFMARYQTTLNLQMDTLEHFTIDIDPDLKRQKAWAKTAMEMERQAQHIQKEMDQLKEAKAFLLANLFPREGKTIPDIRFKKFL